MITRKISRQGGGAGDCAVTNGDDLINHACVMKPPQNPLHDGDQGTHQRARRAGSPERAWEPPVPPTPIPCPMHAFPVWLSLSCMFYNKLEIVSSVGHSSKL